MSKKPIKRHGKDQSVMWQAPRLEGKVKNVGIKPKRKPRKKLGKKPREKK